METLKILEKPTTVDWDYDEEADVLYLAFGRPGPAVGIDIGDGAIVRYDEARHEVVGLTVIGLRQRLLQGLRRDQERQPEDARSAAGATGQPAPPTDAGPLSRTDGGR